MLLRVQAGHTNSVIDQRDETFNMIFLLKRRVVVAVIPLLLCTLLMLYICLLFIHELELTIIEPKQVPELAEGHVFLVVLVLSRSSPSAKLQRQAIRESWGNLIGAKVAFEEEIIPWKVVFLLGNSNNDFLNAQVKDEAAKTKDILVGDFADNYQNLVLKVLMGLRWAKQVDCSFVLKTDDDIYVHLPRLIKWLQSPVLPARLYAGEVVSGNKVVRLPWSKSFVNYRSFGDHIYPEYCRGAFYVLTRNVLADLVNASNARYHTAFPIEDAYIGTLAKSVGLQVVDIEGCRSNRRMYKSFKEWNDDRFSSLICMGDNFDDCSLSILHLRFVRLNNGYQ